MRRLARDAVDRVEMRQRPHRRQFERLLRIDQIHLRPAAFRGDKVAGGEAVGGALHHLRNRIGVHHVARLHRLAIGRALHPRPVGGVDGHQDRADQRLPLAGGGQRRLAHFEMVRGQRALGQFADDDLAGLGHGGSSLDRDVTSKIEVSQLQKVKSLMEMNRKIRAAAPGLTRGLDRSGAPFGSGLRLKAGAAGR